MQGIGNRVNTNINTEPLNTVINNQNDPNDLFKDKLVFSPRELGLGGNRPTRVELTEQQVESKLFQKYGFDPKNKVQMEMLKLRFDTKETPYEAIDWEKGKFVAVKNSKGQYEITIGLRKRTLEALQGRLIYTPNQNRTGNVSPDSTIASRTGIDSANIKKNQIQKLQQPDLTGLTPEQKELVADLAQVGLSVVGIFDPTGIADGADALISIKRGDYWGAGISALGIIPYIGDIAKVGKLPKLLETVGKVVKMANDSPAFAKIVTPLLQNLKKALDALPINKLPNWAREPIEKLKNKIDEFFNGAKKLGGSTEPSMSPNPNRKPDGDPKKVTKNDVDPTNIRATELENESAKILAEQGYKIRQLADNVKGKVTGVKKPDYEIEGKIFDHFAPSKNKNARGIWSTLRDKITDPKTSAKQADRFVVNISDSKLTLEELTKQFKDFPLDNLKEIILVKGNKVIHFFPFK